MDADAGPPFRCYNHVNRSFRRVWGLFDLAGLSGLGLFVVVTSSVSRPDEPPVRRFARSFGLIFREQAFCENEGK